MKIKYKVKCTQAELDKLFLNMIENLKARRARFARNFGKIKVFEITVDEKTKEKLAD